MNFQEFAADHGVRVGRIIPGKWMRFPTDDKPGSRNGAVKFMGSVGWVQNWATMTEPAQWRESGESREAGQRIADNANKAHQEAIRAAEEAARRAQDMLGDAELSTHPYLAAKGFPDEVANVLDKDADNILIIPMRNGTRIVGCQLIRPDGDKKFLYGQRSGGAQFVMGQRGIHVVCEGYATGLSIRRALMNLKVPYVVHVTFSAGNMKKVAATLSGGVVVADNDASRTGERAAQDIGWPYWMSDVVGEDANDYMQRAGLFKLAMGLKQTMNQTRGQGVP